MVQKKRNPFVVSLLLISMCQTPSTQAIDNIFSIFSLFDNIKRFGLVKGVTQELLPPPATFDIELKKPRIPGSVSGKASEFELLANLALKIDAVERPTPLVLGRREILDSKIPLLLRQTDYAKTCFGVVGMQMLTPTSDVSVLKNRQDVIKKLVNYQTLFDEMADILGQIHYLTLDILLYWRPSHVTADLLPLLGITKEQLDFFALQYNQPSALLMQRFYPKLLQELGIDPDQLASMGLSSKTPHGSAKKLFFDLPLKSYVPKIKQLNEYLNTRQSTLQLAAAKVAVNSVGSVWMSIFQSNLVRKLCEFFLLGTTHSIKVEELFFHPIGRQFASLIPWNIMFDEAKYQQYLNAMQTSPHSNAKYKLEHWAHTIQESPWCSAGDLYSILTHYIPQKEPDEISIDLSRIGLRKYSFYESKPAGTKLFGWMLPGHLERAGSGGASNTFASNAADIAKSSLVKAKAVLVISAFRVWDTYNFTHSMRDSISSARTSFANMRGLRAHLMRMRKFVELTQRLRSLAHQMDTPVSRELARSLDLVDNQSLSEKFQEVVRELQSKTFTGAKDSMLYAGGRVLNTFRLLQETKEELVPSLRAIAQLDAYVSIATLVKKGQSAGNKPWAFVEFIEQERPGINFENNWLPLITKNPVPNTIIFGMNDQPNKILLLGPNGGGKSCAIKTIITSTYLAQTWGVVPATKATMTPFNQIIAVLSSDEDIFKDISHFMAAKRDMESVKKRIDLGVAAGQKIMVMLDEPYSGTVDAESGERIYSFGKDIAVTDGILSVIATHVEKPVALEVDTDGIFANYHVVITVDQHGHFTRTYTLKKGVCDWWFNDPQKRRDFIDQLAVG